MTCSNATDICFNKLLKAHVAETVAYMSLYSCRVILVSKPSRLMNQPAIAGRLQPRPQSPETGIQRITMSRDKKTYDAQITAREITYTKSLSLVPGHNHPVWMSISFSSSYNMYPQKSQEDEYETN